MNSTDAKKPIRLGMFLIGGEHWRGGLNYQKSILQILAGPLADRFEAQLFLTHKQLDLASDAFAGLLHLPPIVDDSILGAGKGRKALGSLISGSDAELAEMFRSNGIDVFFENACFLGKDFPIPILSWMPDFQHRALPHLFSKFSWWRREFGFRAQTLGRRTILLSSETARKECESIYKKSRGRTVVVKFAPTIDMTSIGSQAENIIAKYELPRDFIFMPNQFWPHKNHKLVLQALIELKQNGELKNIPPVVMTGSVASNQRDSLLEEILVGSKREGMEQSLIYLGVVPFEDVLALNAASAAVLNPSLFEGWASSVEEAKALGTPLILSNIPVHKEQAPDAVFFDPNDKMALAATLSGFANAKRDGRMQTQELFEAANERKQEFALALSQAIEAASAVA